MSYVSTYIWMNVQRLHYATNDQPLQDHLLSTALLTWLVLSPGRPEQMCRGFPVYPLQDDPPSNTIISTQWALSPRRHELTYRGLTVCLLQDHLLSKPIIPTHWALSPGKPEQCAEALLCHQKLPFQVKLQNSTDSTGSVSWGDLNNECADVFPVSLMNGLFNTIFPLKVSYWLKALSP